MEECYLKAKRVEERDLVSFKEADHMWMWKKEAVLDWAPMGELNEHFHFGASEDGNQRPLLGKPLSKVLRREGINDDGELVGGTTKYLHAMEGDLSTEDGMEGVVKSLIRIKNLSEKWKWKILIFLSLDDEKSRLRKIIEIIFGGTPLEIRICVKRKANKEKRKGEFQKIRKSKMETYTLKPAEGISYVDLVKRMKEKVVTDDIMMKGIERTNEGDVRVRVSGKDEEARKKFKVALEEKMRGEAVVKMWKAEKSMMILDLDSDIAETEIRGVLDEEVNGELGESGTIRIERIEEVAGSLLRLCLRKYGASWPTRKG